MEWFRQAEADLALFEPSIGGFSLWPSLRFSAWQLVSGVRTTGAPAKSIAQRRAEKLFGLATYGLWSLAQKQRLRGKSFDFAVITQEAHRLQTPRGWWDLYLDDVAAHPAFDGRVLRIERRDFAMARTHTVAPRHLFADLQRLSTVRHARTHETTVCSDATCDVLFKRLKVGAVDEQTFRTRARQIALRFQDDLAWYESLWREFRPGAVALVDAYNQHGVVAAAKRCGIPVVEFQHGNVHPDHPGYVWFTPARAIRDRLAIPDRIATYGSFWSDVLLQEGFWTRDEVPAIGSARIDCIRNERSPRPGGRLRILFTSQFATREQTIPLLSEFIHRAESATLDYELAIKVHRNERDQMGEYEALRAISAAVSVVPPYAKDTLEMIAAADVHVSAWSTCHYEAVALGTPTIVLVFPGPDRVEGLKDFSLVSRASSATELFELVKNFRPRVEHSPELGESYLRSEGKKHPTLVDVRREESDRLFRYGAVENAVELMRAISHAQT